MSNQVEIFSAKSRIGDQILSIHIIHNPISSHKLLTHTTAHGLLLCALHVGRESTCVVLLGLQALFHCSVADGVGEHIKVPRAQYFAYTFLPPAQLAR